MQLGPKWRLHEKGETRDDTRERREERRDKTEKREERSDTAKERNTNKQPADTSYTYGSRATVPAYTVPEGILDSPQIPATA